MSDREKLREGLLRQDGIAPGYAPDRHLKVIHPFAAKQKRSRHLAIRSAVGCCFASAVMFLANVFITHFYILSPASSRHMGNDHLGYILRSDKILYITCQYAAIGLLLAGLLVLLIHFFRQRARRTHLRKIETNLPDLAALLGK